jgi:hypothetical protein
VYLVQQIIKNNIFFPSFSGKIKKDKENNSLYLPQTISDNVGPEGQ